jgi:hypothetical protein
VIRGNIESYRKLSREHLDEVKAITSRLGVTPQSLLTRQDASSEGSGRDLAVLSGEADSRPTKVLWCSRRRFRFLHFLRRSKRRTKGSPAG